MTLGGPDLTTFVRKAFKNLMVDEVAINFSWLGMGENIKIKNFKIVEIFQGKF